MTKKIMKRDIYLTALRKKQNANFVLRIYMRVYKKTCRKMKF